MPPISATPVPQVRNNEHGHFPAQNASVENVVFATLRPSLFPALHLRGREYCWFEERHRNRSVSPLAWQVGLPDIEDRADFTCTVTAFTGT